jgi:TRAP-type C4-dicarboxylate transport system permease small subunit
VTSGAFLFDRVTLMSNHNLIGIAEALIYTCLFIGGAAMVIGLVEHFRRKRNKGDDE